MHRPEWTFNLTPMKPRYLIHVYEHGFALDAIPGERGIPCDALQQAMPLFPKNAVMDAGLAHALGVILVIGSPRKLDLWRAEVQAHLDAAYPDPLDRWCHGLDTGASSWAIVSAITFKRQRHCEPRGDTPQDADDFGRCHRLLEAVPQLRGYLSKVAERWPDTAWPRLIAHWAELTDLFTRGDAAALTAKLRELNTQPQ